MEENTKTEKNPIKEAEDLYFLLEHNIAVEAKSLIWHFLTKAKHYYPESNNKDEWEKIIEHLEDVIHSAGNELPSESEIKLIALEKNLNDLIKKEGKSAA